jgi:hypothetical protein
MRLQKRRAQPDLWMWLSLESLSLGPLSGGVRKSVCVNAAMRRAIPVALESTPNTF